jgi:histidinol dehydrogenase
MKIFNNPSKSEWNKLCERPVLDFKQLENVVSSILQDVKINGDIAARNLTQKFDNVLIDNFKVSEKELREAEINCPEELKKAIKAASTNIEKFHSIQKEQTIKTETSPGVLCWRKSVAIEKVGLYIPGGSAPLFSTVLMLSIPAKIAGCGQIIVCTPPDRTGKIHPAVLYACIAIGVTEIFKIGGVQAIGAMAYGTESIPQVYKIFGPGNQYVTAAKQQINKEGIAIDMPAGPSEVLVYADETAIPEFVAADLLSQAEHGADSQVILLADNNETISKVIEEIRSQIDLLPRKHLAHKALEKSRAIVIAEQDKAVDFINAYAPEHLILAIKNDDDIAERIINAGSVFLGNYTPESAGDYASGTNHTLPTNGFAKAYSGVSLDSFLKKITFQKISREGIVNLGKTIETMAQAEGLDAHKNAVSVRLKEVGESITQ